MASKLKIGVAGIGAIGSWFTTFARNIPDTSWVLVDCDRVEPKNVLSQAFDPSCINRNKADAMALTALRYWGFGPDQYTSRGVEITGLNIDAVFADVDLIVDCLDNAPSRRLLIGAGKKLVVPVVHAGIDNSGSYGVIRWCPNFNPDPSGRDTGATCEDGANLPHHAHAASLLAKVVKTFVATGKRIDLDVPGMRSVLV